MDKKKKVIKGEKKVARLYRRKGANVKKELSFTTPKSTKLA